jgi:hypothetical protein
MTSFQNGECTQLSAADQSGQAKKSQGWIAWKRILLESKWELNWKAVDWTPKEKLDPRRQKEGVAHLLQSIWMMRNQRSEDSKTQNEGLAILSIIVRISREIYLVLVPNQQEAETREVRYIHRIRFSNHRCKKSKVVPIILFRHADSQSNHKGILHLMKIENLL